MGGRLSGCVVAMLVADGVDGGQVKRLREILRREGGRLHLLSPGGGPVRPARGGPLAPDADAHAIHARYYDALLVPGGAATAKALAQDEAVQELVRSFQLALRPVGAVGEGVEVLCAAGLAKGHRLCGPSALRELVIGAGGQWVEGEVAIDRLVVTGRDGAHLEPFADALAAEIAELRWRDEVEESSMESFPASDAHGGSVAI